MRLQTIMGLSLGLAFPMSWAAEAWKGPRLRPCRLNPFPIEDHVPGECFVLSRLDPTGMRQHRPCQTCVAFVRAERGRNPTRGD